jgi:hypothetical protein
MRPEGLVGVWPQVEPYLQRALRHGQGDETDAPHVLAALLQGISTMLVAHEDDEVFGAVIMRVSDHDTCRKIWLDFVIGRKMSRWIDQVEDFLREYMEIVDAKCVEGSCRPGIAKVLERRGHKRKAVIMEFNP